MPISQLVGANSNDDQCKTFVIENEGHTLGNALRCIIAGYGDIYCEFVKLAETGAHFENFYSSPEVEFCAYTVPHPMEATLHFRIQMRNGRAVDALRRGLEDLATVADHILEKFETELDTFENQNLSND